MNSWTIYILTLVINFILIFIFAWLSIVFSEKIFTHRRSSFFKKFVLCAVGSLACTYFVSQTTIDMLHFTIYAGLFISYLILYGYRELSSHFFIVNAYMLNIMTIRMIVTSLVSLSTGLSLCEASYSSPFLSELTLFITIITLIIFLIVIIRIVPGKNVHRVSQLKELRQGMNLFMFLSNLYLMIQGSYYSSLQIEHFTLVTNLIAVCALLLFANWAFLFYNMRILNLLDVRAENERMQIMVDTLNVAASTDGLTGLLNKAATIQSIDKIISKGGALFVIDVDNFKEMNDTLGHAIGDQLLQLIAEQLRQLFRDCDILGRFGGDEFLVFLSKENLTKESVEKKASDLCRQCTNTMHSDTGASLASSISVGALMISANEFQDFADAFKYADQALYSAKRKGKNTYVTYRYLTLPPLET